MPDTGHDLSLERTAPIAHRRMIGFVEDHVGSGSGRGVRGSTPGVRPTIPQPEPQKAPLHYRLLGTAFSAAVAPRCWTGTPTRSTRSPAWETRAVRFPG